MESDYQRHLLDICWDGLLWILIQRRFLSQGVLQDKNNQHRQSSSLTLSMLAVYMLRYSLENVSAGPTCVQFSRFQQPMMIGPYFDFLNTLPVANECRDVSDFRWKYLKTENRLKNFPRYRHEIISILLLFQRAFQWYQTLSSLAYQKMTFSRKEIEIFCLKYLNSAK